jgi:hypothetical protein
MPSVGGFSSSTIICIRLQQITPQQQHYCTETSLARLPTDLPPLSTARGRCSGGKMNVDETSTHKVWSGGKYRGTVTLVLREAAVNNPALGALISPGSPRRPGWPPPSTGPLRRRTRSTGLRRSNNGGERTTSVSRPNSSAQPTRVGRDAGRRMRRVCTGAI